MMTDCLESYVNNFKDIFQHGDKSDRIVRQVSYKNIWLVKSCSHDTRSIGMLSNE